MKTKRVIQAIAGVVLAGGLAADVSASLIGYVQLGGLRIVESAGLGGVSEAQIVNYAPAATPLNVEYLSNLLGDTGDFLYMMCIEFDQTWDTSNRWYAIYEGLVGQPSSTLDITVSEARVIEQVLTAEFTGLDFGTQVASNRSAWVDGLQALVWEAGANTGHGAANSNVTEDFAAPVVGGRSTGGKVRAQNWISTYGTSAQEINVMTFALVAVDPLSNNSTPTAGYKIATHQDFMVYRPGSSSAPVPAPAPAPFVLIGLGLVAMFGLKRRPS